MDKQRIENLTKNALGYWEVVAKPTQDELREYYASKYYQEAQGSYEHAYSDAELEYFETKLEQRWSVVKHLFPDAGSMLDVGCGEGFALAFFKKLGWEVRGLDFSRAGISSMNPECAGDLIDGDVFELLNAERTSEAKYDLIWLQHVLEHVVDPVDLMQSLRGLVKPGGALVLTVPNDFSDLQMQALEQGHIDRSFWVALPDHLSYFSMTSLENIGKATGWNCLEVLSSFPIDWFLFHPASNYVQDRSAGKPAHKARVELENLIGQRPVEDTVRFYSAMAKIGMGRDLTAFYTPQNNTK